MSEMNFFSRWLGRHAKGNGDGDPENRDKLSAEYQCLVNSPRQEEGTGVKSQRQELPKIRIYYEGGDGNTIAYRCPLIRGWELRCPAIPECHRNAVRRSLLAYVRALQSAGEQVPEPLRESFVVRFYEDKHAAR